MPERVFFSNLHTHSMYSDGESSMEKLVLAALDKGFVSLGFSDHAPSVYEPGAAMLAEDEPAYRAEFLRLRDRYASRIELYLGLERDALAPTFNAEGLDYVIGSVHLVRDSKGRIHCIDYQPEMYEAAIRAFGDIQGLVRAYYAQVMSMVERIRPNIVGHLDLIGKLNEDNRYFDPEADWYRTLAGQAMDTVAAAGCIVEVNTALTRLNRREPYPSRALLAGLIQRGVPLTISSDAHRTSHLDHWFGEAEELLRELGCKAVKVMRGGAFVDLAL